MCIFIEHILIHVGGKFIEFVLRGLLIIELDYLALYLPIVHFSMGSSHVERIDTSK